MKSTITTLMPTQRRDLNTAMPLEGVNKPSPHENSFVPTDVANGPTASRAFASYKIFGKKLSRRSAVGANDKAPVLHHHYTSTGWASPLDRAPGPVAAPSLKLPRANLERCVGDLVRFQQLAKVDLQHHTIATATGVGVITYSSASACIV